MVDRARGGCPDGRRGAGPFPADDVDVDVVRGPDQLVDRRFPEPVPPPVPSLRLADDDLGDVVLAGVRHDPFGEAVRRDRVDLRSQFFGQTKILVESLPVLGRKPRTADGDDVQAP